MTSREASGGNKVSKNIIPRGISKILEKMKFFKKVSHVITLRISKISGMLYFRADLYKLTIHFISNKTSMSPGVVIT